METLFLGPFNALASTVVKDLEGFAFGSNQFNAGKVLPQDHTFFGATAAWMLEVRPPPPPAPPPPARRPPPPFVPHTPPRPRL